MRILHINSYYFSSNFYKNLYDVQQKGGKNIKVYVPISRDKSFTERDFGAYTAISRNHKKFDRLFFYLKHNKIWRDLDNREKLESFSIIHAHSLFSNGFIAMKIKEKYDIPYIVAIRNTDVNIFFKKMPHLRKLGLKILNNANKVVFLSETYKNIVLNNYIPAKDVNYITDKTEVIPNGISEFWFNNLGLVKKIECNKKMKLLYVGDVNKNKNILKVIQAITHLEKQEFDVEFTIVGKIVDKKIFNKIKRFSFVKYLGIQSKENLIEIYRHNDIFVMPSITETFGLVYVEAMSQGLPVIYSKGQGFDNQFLNGEVGYNVVAQDSKDIAEKIVMALNDYEKISENAIHHALKFRWNILEEKYNDIYSKII